VRWWCRALNWRKRLHFIPNASPIPGVVLTDIERATVREGYAPPGKALLAFFGFFFEHKGIDDLLAIVEPERHHLVMIGEIQESDPYQAALARRLRQEPFSGSVTTTGFLPPPEVARILAAADAVVLPFRHGGGSWNTTIKASVLQGTFVLTTSVETHGFDAERNLYWARPGDTADMRRALDRYLGRRRTPPSPDTTWAEIARRHLELYDQNLA
jgi:glycosyltransferase involved in cell wall biosynthesis